MRNLLTRPWWRVPIGTRTLILGVHTPAIHTYYVAKAWTQTYGFPWNYKIWAAFLLHDLGYLSCRDLDGEQGELHPLLGAKIMGKLFGQEWKMFMIGHSRFLSKRYQIPYSRLCVADKLSMALYPRWLYLLLANCSGEVHEYMSTYMTRTVSGIDRINRGEAAPGDQRDWFDKTARYLRAWALEHRDLKPDTWTRPGAIDITPEMNGVRV